TTPDNGAAAQTLPDDLKIPADVPLRATGPASKTATRIIRRWLAALDRGDIERAAHFFALPSKFQNAGTPVLHIDSEAERIAINLSLTCGARAEETGGAGAYTIVQFRLTERKGPGAACATTSRPTPTRSRRRAERVDSAAGQRRDAVCPASCARAARRAAAAWRSKRPVRVAASYGGVAGRRRSRARPKRRTHHSRLSVSMSIGRFSRFRCGPTQGGNARWGRILR